MGTAVGQYVTPTLLKERLDVGQQHDWSAADDALLGKICDGVNQWIETLTETVLAPFEYVDAVFDGLRWPRGPVLERGRSLLLVRGIHAVTTLELAPEGGSYAVETGFVIRPGPYERRSGEAATRITLTSGTYPEGYATIRLNGTGGPPAIPDDVRDTAAAVAQRSWHGMKAGRTDQIQTIDADGNVIVSRFVTADDKRKLLAYRPVLIP